MKTTLYRQFGPLLATMLLLVSFLLTACGDTPTVTSNIAFSFLPTITPSTSQTTIPTNTASTSVDTTVGTTSQITAPLATSQTTAPTTTVAPTINQTTVPITTASQTTATTMPIIINPPTTPTLIPTTSAPTTTKVAATTTPAPQPGTAGYGSQDNLPVSGFGTKGVCSSQTLLKMAGVNFKLISEQPATIAEQTMKVVFIGKNYDSQSDSFEEIRGFAVGPNCANMGAYTLIPYDHFGEWKPKVTVRDIHGDGQQEIIVDGGQGAHWSLTQVFAFDKKQGVFRVQGFFGGDGGAGLFVPNDFKSAIKDGALSANRDYSLSQLLHDTVYQWSPAQQKYVVATQQIDFNFGPPEKLQYPNEAVLLYYQSINHKDYQTAYNLLSPKFRQSLSYDSFVKGFATTKQVWVKQMMLPYVETASSVVTFKYEDGSYDVPLSIVAVDEVGNGQTKQTEFQGKWTVVIVGGVPYLEAPNITQVKS